MSAINDIDITCEQCTDEFRGSVWTAVHAGEDPELKDLLLGGELNLVMCPHCGHVAFHDQFLLYTEPAAELVAYVYPKVQEGEAEFLETMMVQSFEQAQAGLDPKDRSPVDRPTLLFGLETLSELLREETEREEQSEVAKAVCKERGISVTSLKRSRARELETVFVLPLSQSRLHTRESVMTGLAQLLETNPALSLYASLKVRFHQDASFDPFSMPAKPSKAKP